MAITNAMCTSFKAEMPKGYHAFDNSVRTADVFKIALYTSSATLGASTTAYTTANEVSGTGYTAGGRTLTVSVAPTSSGTTSYWSFSDPTWTSATFTANGALIYNSSQGNRAVATIAFGSDKSPAGQSFTINFPTADPTSAILRIE